MADDVPSGFRTNPEGGGGDQFIHLFVVRQGKYGMHRTMVGKIVHRRPRHYWNSNDLQRILPKVAEQEEKTDVDFTWWQKLMNWAAEYMISKLTTWVALDDDLVKMVWAFINSIWNKFIRKISGSNSFLENTIKAYDARLMAAVESYTKDGDYSLLEALANDIAGG
jgi:hypothetical protein